MKSHGKEIIILNGSPRPKGNTAALVASFTEGAISAGNSVTRFDLSPMNIKPCIGCMKGGQNPSSPCVQKDDMERIYPVFSRADIVVLASPLYYWTVTGLLKIAFDRLYATVEANNHTVPPKTCALLMAAGNANASVYEPGSALHRAQLERMNWTDGGSVFATGLMMPGDSTGTHWLEDARQLGASI